MAVAQGIRAGRAFVELFADDSKLVRGLRGAESKLKTFGNATRNFGLQLTAIGGAIITPLLASAKTFATYGDSIAKMATRTGLSVEALSGLQYAANQSGVNVDELEAGLRGMIRTIYDAQSGTSTAIRSLAELNLTVADFANLDVESQFKLLADRLSQIDQPSHRAALAMEIFGKSGMQLLPLLANGAHGISILQDQAKQLGLVMSTEDAQAAVTFNDLLDRLWKTVRMGVVTIGAALAPELGDVVIQITKIISVITDWIKKNRGFIVSIIKIGATIAAIGVGLTVLGTIISGLASTFGVLAKVVVTISAVLKPLAALITFFVSPIGLVIASLIALGGVLLHVTGAGSKALDWLGDRFTVLKNDAKASFSGIADALMAGDIKQAFKVLWLFIKLEWKRGTNFLEQIWLNFRNFFIKVGYDAWSSLLVLVENIWHSLEIGWLKTTDFFSKIWSKFATFFAITWQDISAEARKAWNWVKGLADKSFDVEAENRLADEVRDAAIARIESEQKQRLVEYDVKRQELNKLHKDTLEEIAQKNLEKYNQLNAEYAKNIAENEAELARAEKEWREAIKEARERRRGKEKAPVPAGAPVSPMVPESLESLDTKDLLQREAAKIGVVGTFNPAGLFSFESLAFNRLTSATEKTAQATQETAQNTKRLLEGMKSGMLIFASP